MDWCEGVIIEIGFYLCKCVDKVFVIGCKFDMLFCYWIGFGYGCGFDCDVFGVVDL